jgi:hypothetical protein
MRNVATIGILIGALAVAALPARAEDQAIGFAPASSVAPRGRHKRTISKLEPHPGNGALSKDRRGFHG